MRYIKAPALLYVSQLYSLWGKWADEENASWGFSSAGAQQRYTPLEPIRTRLVRHLPWSTRRINASRIRRYCAVTSEALPGRAAGSSYGFRSNGLNGSPPIEELRVEEAVAGREHVGRVGARHTTMLRSGGRAPRSCSGISFDCRHDTFIFCMNHCACPTTPAPHNSPSLKPCIASTHRHTPNERADLFGPKDSTP